MATKSRFRYTAGMRRFSTALAVVATGAGKRVRHWSVCTWQTRQTDGPLRHSGEKKGMPFSTSIMRSAFPNRVAHTMGARKYWE